METRHGAEGVNEPLPRGRKPLPTLRPAPGFEPVRLETPETPKRSWFHCMYHGKNNEALRSNAVSSEV
ncbi:hypothetical protein E2C01_065734 [Portunus trituberculatus]|uniref:Uncharacterized protein n=1 Tax=Portunus trituberculatus TaxID=210409 RepID=A0A5B7HQE4_PORTR|nr:hypothetical protein [Portunus trituberculatus]